MIAADTSTWIAWLQREPGDDVGALRQAITMRELRVIPVVLTELLSGANLPAQGAETLAATPTLELLPGYWERTGLLRYRVLASKRRARLGDALIAQCCLDHDVPLLTRDRDFLAFAEAAGLEARLFPGSA